MRKFGEIFFMVKLLKWRIDLDFWEKFFVVGNVKLCLVIVGISFGIGMFINLFNLKDSCVLFER